MKKNYDESEKYKVIASYPMSNYYDESSLDYDRALIRLAPNKMLSTSILSGKRDLEFSGFNLKDAHRLAQKCRSIKGLRVQADIHKDYN
jgi:hypothetical protein